MAKRGDRMRRAIGAFTERCLRENDALARAVRIHRFDLVDVSTGQSADALARDLASRLT